MPSSPRPQNRARQASPLLLILVWLLTCVIWSTVWFFIKVGVTDLPPITFAVYRLAVALLVLVPLMAVRRIPLPRDAVGHVDRRGMARRTVSPRALVGAVCVLGGVSIQMDVVKLRRQKA